MRSLACVGWFPLAGSRSTLRYARHVRALSNRGCQGLTLRVGAGEPAEIAGGARRAGHEEGVTVRAVFEGPFGELSSSPQEIAVSASIIDNGCRMVVRLRVLMDGPARATLARSTIRVSSAGERYFLWKGLAVGWSLSLVHQTKNQRPKTTISDESAR